MEPASEQGWRGRPAVPDCGIVGYRPGARRSGVTRDGALHFGILAAATARAPHRDDRLAGCYSEHHLRNMGLLLPGTPGAIFERLAFAPLRFRPAVQKLDGPV